MTETQFTIRERLGVEPPQAADWINLFLFGDTGVGKTHFIGTAADCEDTYPLLVIDCEGGLATIRKRQNIDVIRAKSVKDLERVHNELFMDTSSHYRCTAIDSLTELQDIDMRDIMRDAKLRARNPDAIDEDVPAPREWGKSRNHMRKIVRAFRDLPMHCIVTALHTEVQEEGKPNRFQPDLPGKQNVEIPGFMDIVAYYFKEADGSRTMQFAGTRRVPKAKTRYAELGDMLKDPTMSDVFNLLKQET